MWELEKEDPEDEDESELYEHYRGIDQIIFTTGGNLSPKTKERKIKVE